jgi:hypothetical protein
VPRSYRARRPSTLTLHHISISPTAPSVRDLNVYLLGLALEPSDPRARVRLFGQNLRAARGASFAGQLQLGNPTEPQSLEEGVERAVLEASRLIRAGVLHSDVSRLRLALDTAAAVATGGMGVLLLTPWEGLAIGAAAAAAQSRFHIGERLGVRVATSSRRLSALAKSPSGILEFIEV